MSLKKKCTTPYCRNDGVAKKGGLCHKCDSRKYAREHPFRYHYNALRNNARRRGKAFSLTFKEFKEIWQKHPDKWAEKKKWGSECKWQMDRKDPREGYHKDNIKIITKSKNVIKYHKKGRFIMEAYWAQQTELALDEEAPF